jgi:hypoxanthine phosphoribosyltransferase
LQSHEIKNSIARAGKQLEAAHPKIKGLFVGSVFRVAAFRRNLLVARIRPGASLQFPALHLLADIERVLLNEQEIATGLDRVAAEITDAFAGEEFTAIAVLKGSCVFVADLIRRIPTPLRLSFAAVSSYVDHTRPGELIVQLLPPDEEFQGRAVLLVDDILDTGRTLRWLTKELVSRGAGSVRTCVFLDKPARRQVDVRADFCCFEIEDAFVVGYGLDYAGRYRNLPFVGALRVPG